MIRPTSNASGFTLVELAIVLAIVAILSVAVLKGQSLLRAGEITDTIALVQDLKAATGQFRQRFHYLPGDFPIDTTIPEIDGIGAPCRIGGANAGNGNGLIEVAESACAAEELIRAGLLRGDPVSPLRSRFGTVTLMAASASGIALPTSVRNVILFDNLPCDVALSMDIKLDDGNLGSGNIRASTACTDAQPISLAVPL